MANSAEQRPNERLRRARILHKWSQADLAERVGTSFEMVSRWERGVTIPSAYYQEHLCAALGKTGEELGFGHEQNDALTVPSAPFVFLASSHSDADKPIVSHLKTTLQDRGITLWSSRQIGRQDTATLPDIIRSAQAIVVLISPEARSSRHVRTTLELARTFQCPVYGIWIEGESWQECLPDGTIELITPIDARKGDNPALLEEIAATIAQTGQASRDTDAFIPVESEVQVTAKPSLFVAPVVPNRGKNFFNLKGGLLIGMTVLIIAGGVLGGFSLRSYFHAINTQSNLSAIARGGTWISALNGDPDSFIPNGSRGNATGQQDASGTIDQALYLPLFYGDSQGVIHAGAATEVPSIQNGGVNANATIWTFHLRPHLVWTDGQSYDARDVDYTWRLWLNPDFGGPNTLVLNMISRADVSLDNLSITFHLKQPFAPFLADLWVDGVNAPLPSHHFRSIAPASILKSSDNLNPQITSGPFIMSEIQPGNHYTLIRNPRYYLTSKGQPYLDKVIFVTNAPSSANIKPLLQAGLLDASSYILNTDPASYKQMQSFTNYTFFPQPSNSFEALYFNFHNTILATHLEVRKAIAMAVDQPALIKALRGFANPLCIDHTPIYHPGYEPLPPCPLFDLTAANKLLEDNGWLKGADGVRAKAGQRLEFEYSVALSNQTWRLDDETILQGDLQKIGIKLDIQNYPPPIFFDSFLSHAPASPPTGAVAGRYDIAEFANGFTYDPDDSSLLECDQTPPVGINFNFYCNHALDALYKQEQATADPGIRQQIFVQIHRIYLTQFPFIVLSSPFFVVMAKKRVHNFQPSPFYISINMEEWWCDQGKC